MTNINILIGGKLGDFLLTLYGVKGLCEYKNAKASIYMIDHGWEFGVQSAFNELYPILKKQNYINDLKILTDYELDPIQTATTNSPIKIKNKTLIDEGYIVDNYISSNFLYKKCWSEIYSNLFDFPVKNYSPIIKHDFINDKFLNKVLIHRKYQPERFNQQFPYRDIIDHYKGEVIFISSNQKDYEMFPYKNDIEYIHIHAIHDWLTAINSCSLFIGNLTAPIVMAHILDKLRIIELPNNVDLFHWIGEEKYSNNIKWFLNSQTNNLQ